MFVARCADPLEVTGEIYLFENEDLVLRFIKAKGSHWYYESEPILDEYFVREVESEAIEE